MASALDTGCGTVRQLTGTCDWCGHECHPDAEICVALSCQRCDSKLYHQGCVEKYLKKIGLAATRKIGFPCPFGKGKVTQEECKGRVEKAHPIVPKNEKKKQQRLAPQMLEAMAKQPKAPKPPAPAAPKAAAAGKAPARKMNPPKLHTLHTAARSLVSPSAATNSGAGPSGVWGSKGAAPVFANAHLPAPPDDDAAADADSLSGAAGGGGPRPAQLPVGLVLEEALTKAQKKNLARKKKRAAAGGLESASQTSEDHQELIAAAMQEMQQAAAGGRGVGAGGSGSSASSTTGSTATGLMGFDGAAVMGSSQHDVLAQQGHRFITDASQYAALLGLYMGDDSDDEEEGGEYEEEGSETEVQQEQGSYDFNEAPAAVVSASTPTPVIIDYNNNSNNLAGYVAPDAHAVEPPSMAVAAGKDDGVSEASAFDAAVAASIQQYQLEEEMRKQREALTHGFGSGGGSGSGGFGASKPSFMQAPVVAPVAAPVVAPVMAPSTPSVLFPQTKQQPEVVASTPANNSNWVFGGAGGGATALPPHIPAAYAAQYPTAASGGATMAAGHTGQEASAADDDDDDDLGTLLALCGVAC